MSSLTREQIEVLRQDLKAPFIGGWKDEQNPARAAMFDALCDMALRALPAGEVAVPCGLCGAYLAAHAALTASSPAPVAAEAVARKLIDRAFKMMEMAGYRVAVHKPDHNNPIIGWMADAREYLATRPAPANESLDE